ncbi:hypothetical protein EYM_05790 [Ignicoccus islandicus DSM 13165]|uniref:CRISPR system ring nuclease SSO1393-like domain-containing protein n=1 Tax=Ignicoccus islandicus DSM 13165 TaxID=940295 RepID=A0A0U3EBC3_9CREN|nr:putative CRISPR-associated protein [Ignicoccus islandicus]ALU12622.1 hypothetical protein EYM_05790 [Ignicoccus islandicus DSM 13165]
MTNSVMGSIGRGIAAQLQDRLKEIVNEDLERLASNKVKCGEKVNAKLDDLVEVVREHPEIMSAELNSLIKFMRSIYINNGKEPVLDEVSLICSETPTGAASCYVLREVLERGIDVDGYYLKPKVSTYVVKALGNLGSSFSPASFYVGLLNLVCCALRLCERGWRVLANLTGGFKPEVAYTTAILMALSNIESIYYVHEGLKDVVLLPLLNLVVSSVNFKERLSKEPYKSYYQRALGELYEVFVNEIENCILGRTYLMPCESLEEYLKRCKLIT